LANPLRHPHALVEDLTTTAFSLRDKLLLGALVTRTVMSSDSLLLSRCVRRDDLSTQDFLRRFGFSALFVARFAKPFFGGVLLDGDLATSAGLFLYYLKKFTTGRAWLPAGGIAALPAQMTSALPPKTLRLRTRVISLDIKNDRTCGVTLEHGERIAASTIVLALDEPSICHLLGRPSPVPARSVAVVYFKSRQSVYPHSCLVLPESGNRRVRHFAQVTNVAPEFAPPGFHLISASVLDFLYLSDESLSHVVKNEIASLFPNTSHSLEYLETIRVPYAVPAQPPGFANRKPIPNLPAGVFAAGDWASGASIQSAISSGLDSAHSILNPLCP
jgi:phytoene dehydrogenase-like protein